MDRENIAQYLKQMNATFEVLFKDACTAYSKYKYPIDNPDIIPILATHFTGLRFVYTIEYGYTKGQLKIDPILFKSSICNEDIDAGAELNENWMADAREKYAKLCEQTHYTCPAVIKAFIDGYARGQSRIK